MIHRRLSLLVLPLALAACDAPSKEPSVAATASAAVVLSRSEAQTLALSDPGDTTPIDAEIRAAQQVVEALPKSTDKLVLLGRAWVKKARQTADGGFYLNARACADLALAIDPDASIARELHAQVHLNQHQFLDAITAADLVLAKDDESLLAHAVKSDALFELGRIDEAMKLADRMVELKPDLASYTRVSYFQWLRGDGGMALRSIKLAIESSRDPVNTEPRAYALVQAANYFFLKGDYEGADEGYKQALAIFIDYPPALVGRARVAMTKGEAKHAAELLQIAFKGSPLTDTAWRLGDALSLAGDAEGAKQAYATVVKVGRTTDPRTLSLFLSTKNQDADEALRLAQEEMKLRPGIYTEDVLAWALYRKGQLAEAKEASDRALRLGTVDPVLLYHAGAIRIALGDRAAGEELVRRALDLSPSFDATAAEEARALLR